MLCEFLFHGRDFTEMMEYEYEYSHVAELAHMSL